MASGSDLPDTSKEHATDLSAHHAALSIDPVCGMTVDPATAAASFTHAGKTYFFCNPSCLDKFRANPEQYLRGGPVSHSAPQLHATDRLAHSEKMEYVCPMHPEVISDRPGACPKCGMALEPRVAAAEEGPSPELLEMTRRFWIGLIVSLPLFFLAMGGMVFPPLDHFLHQPLALWGSSSSPAP